MPCDRVSLQTDAVDRVWAPPPLVDGPTRPTCHTNYRAPLSPRKLRKPAADVIEADADRAQRVLAIMADPANAIPCHVSSI